MTIDGVTPVHTDILFQNEITGADMLDRVTGEMLERWGLPGGPAGRIMSSINSADAVVPVSKGESTGASHGFVCVVFFAEGKLVGRSLRLLCAIHPVLARGFLFPFVPAGIPLARCLIFPQCLEPFLMTRPWASMQPFGNQ